MVIHVKKEDHVTGNLREPRCSWCPALLHFFLPLVMPRDLSAALPLNLPTSFCYVTQALNLPFVHQGLFLCFTA